MKSLILGTAGHIDHGKTALVARLTGVDTDRLKEEKARGITIELGFAELTLDDDTHFGVVDVPGHEAFVRAMVAGAAGMDVVLLVVAADEGVMPQTREHLAIIQLLGVGEVIVAITKSDLADPEWTELVEAEIGELLAPGPYADAALVRTSSETGEGIEALLSALLDAAGRVAHPSSEDLVRLPLDRVFTIQGTGTVVTGTLWSGRLEKGARVRILPQELAGRVRGVQVHGHEVSAAEAGDRTAVALSGDASDREFVVRGATLITDPDWAPSRMLTARVRLLEDTRWSLEHNQRLRAHVGTAEVMARCTLLESSAIGPGGTGWVQLRLEEPVVARAQDRVVLRAYSPVTTIGGGIVAEPMPPKRNRLDVPTRALLDALLDGGPSDRLEAAAALHGWGGLHLSEAPVLIGLTPMEIGPAAEKAVAAGALTVAGRLFHADLVSEAETVVLTAVDDIHEREPLRAVAPPAALRAALPGWAHATLADGVIGRLTDSGALAVAEGGVRRPGHEAKLTVGQRAVVDALLELLGREGLATPFLAELPDSLGSTEEVGLLLRHLQARGDVRQIADGYFVRSDVMDEAIARVRETLRGREGLGPADFRDALPVSRKQLIPLLNHLDGEGVTLRDDSGRSVP
jgi:selenocysteine-specific elongation factor